MLLAGGHADQEQLARFSAEAEAVAQLQHPNIVQIHDVGVHLGLPYFSLEFVDGNPLDVEISGKPQKPKRAAELIEVLARAIHYAHQRGIVHRDLKPANILLTSEGTPKISDFGLVKRLEGDSGQTATGTIMGTPIYMAPEQGRGDKNVGLGADVYALGAILYELLTGRPPFLGTTPVDTLMRLRNESPVPPSRLQPKAPLDLETICLKCLRKDVRKRYDDAEELAEDLRRFQAGEPITARRVSLAERLWRWRRRNPRLAIAGAMACLLALTITIGGPAAALVINEQKQLAVEAQVLAQDREKQARAAEEIARENEKRAQENEEKAHQAEQRADLHAKSASQQRQLALNALGTLVTEVQEQLEDTPATYQLKQTLLRSAAEGLRRVAKSAEGSGSVDVTMASAHQRMGKIFMQLGETSDAMNEYQQVHGILERLAVLEPENLRAQRNVSVSFKMLGDASRVCGDPDAAREYYARSLNIRRELADANPNDVGLKVDLAQALLAVGNVSELEEKRDYYEQALILREYLAKKASGGDRAKRMRDVWITHGMLGDLHSSLDNATEAKECYSEALRLARELCPADEQSPRQRLDLAHSYVNLGNSKRTLGETEPAKQDYTKALDILTLLAENDPRNIEVQTSYLLTLARAGQHEKASKQAPKTRDLAPDNVLHLYNIACCHSICVSAVADGRPLDQLSPERQSLQTEYAKQAIALLEEAIAKGLDDFEYLKIDPDIAPIREYPDYRKLLEGRE